MDAPPQELQDPRELDYAELAAEVPEPDAQEPPVEPVKRKRGRPLGSRNKPKPPPEVPEPPEPSEASEASESEPATPIKPKPRARPPRAKPKQTPALDADFHGAGPPKPVRLRRQHTASSLMELIAGAAAQRGEQDRHRRRAFYETFLPI